MGKLMSAFVLQGALAVSVNAYASTCIFVIDGNTGATLTCDGKDLTSTLPSNPGRDAGIADATVDIDWLRTQQGYQVIGQAALTAPNGDQQVWWTLIK